MKEPEIKKKKSIYQGKFISLQQFEVEQEGEKIQGEVINFPQTVGILVFTDKGQVLLVKQFRLPPEKELWEIPAGKIDQGESPKEAAKRELKEETGFKARKLEKMGSFYVSPGYTTEYMHLFRCQAGEKKKQALDQGEFIDKIGSFETQKAWQMIGQGEIEDSKTILALALNKLDYKLSRK